MIEASMKMVLKAMPTMNARSNQQNNVCFYNNTVHITLFSRLLYQKILYHLYLVTL